MFTATTVSRHLPHFARRAAAQRYRPRRGHSIGRAVVHHHRAAAARTRSAARLVDHPELEPHAARLRLQRLVRDLARRGAS
jgi:hypothetical protein